jgi:hypothetical protein
MDRKVNMTNTITVKTGVGEIKALYESLLKGNHADFACLATDYEKVLGDWYDQEFAPKLTKLNTREVISDTHENRQSASNKSSHNQTRFLSESAESDLVVGEDFVAIVSFNKDNPSVVLIEDESIVQSAKVWFNTIWLAASR